MIKARRLIKARRVTEARRVIETRRVIKTRRVIVQSTINAMNRNRFKITSVNSSEYPTFTGATQH